MVLLDVFQIHCPHAGRIVGMVDTAEDNKDALVGRDLYRIDVRDCVCVLPSGDGVLEILCERDVCGEMVQLGEAIDDARHFAHVVEDGIVEFEPVQMGKPAEFGA